MSALHQKLQVLEQHHNTNKNNPTTKEINQMAQDLQKNIKYLVHNIQNPDRTTEGDLERQLAMISSFFRDGKFSTFVVPVLKALQSLDADQWKEARYTKEGGGESTKSSTNMPITPDFFATLPQSRADVVDENGDVEKFAVRVREMVLLSVYDTSIDMTKIGQAYFQVRKKQNNT